VSAREDGGQQPATGRGAAAKAGSAAWAASRWAGSKVQGHIVDAVGGPARARVIFLFACVLALNSADTATIGAVAPQLHDALHIGTARIGLLSSVTLLVGAVFVLPCGMLVDRTKRVPMLAASIVLWSAASALSAFAGSYETLLLTRLLLGAVTATAGPAIASLTGDYFPSRERGRIYAYILGGEIAGTAFGFTISGSVSSAISWQAAFILLAIPGLFLARALWRTVPEPQRGGQSRLERGVVDLRSAVASPEAEFTWQQAGEQGDVTEDLAYQAVAKRGVSADPELVLREDPARMSILDAVRYVLSIPTNLVLIISSALGYFFYSGLLTFLVVFVEGHYHVGFAETTAALLVLVVASVIGTLISGRLTDNMVRHGFLEARVWVPAICYVAATALFVPGILISHLNPALWFDAGGAALLSAANPPLDAARLDIIPPGLWGRAESTRTLLRSLAQALAPLVFGLFADLIGGISGVQQAPVGVKPSKNPGHGASLAASATGLEWAFLVLLVTLAAAGWFMAKARTTYARDVATAAAASNGRSGAPATPATPS
jgi:MFS family permease